MPDPSCGPATIVSNRAVDADHWLLTWEREGRADASAVPGQFVMVRRPDQSNPFLPRPFSVNNAWYVRGRDVSRTRILFRIVGTGTRLLSATRAGDPLVVTGPLGRGFSRFSGRPVVLVAGGYGVAPLLFWRQRYGRGRSVTLVIGARDASRLVLADRAARTGQVLCATEDGSVGYHGLVTGPLTDQLASGGSKPALVACGPTGMLRAVAQLASQRGLACEVSLESYMACGCGVCLGCVVADGRGRYRTVCREGPVFDAADLGHMADIGEAGA